MTTPIRFISADAAPIPKPIARFETAPLQEQICLAAQQIERSLAERFQVLQAELLQKLQTEVVSQITEQLQQQLRMREEFRASIAEELADLLELAADTLLAENRDSISQKRLQQMLGQLPAFSAELESRVTGPGQIEIRTPQGTLHYDLNCHAQQVISVLRSTLFG